MDDEIKSISTDEESILEFKEFEIALKDFINIYKSNSIVNELTPKNIIEFLYIVFTYINKSYKQIINELLFFNFMDVSSICINDKIIRSNELKNLINIIKFNEIKIDDEEIEIIVASLI